MRVTESSPEVTCQALRNLKETWSTNFSFYKQTSLKLSLKNKGVCTSHYFWGPSP